MFSNSEKFKLPSLFEKGMKLIHSLGKNISTFIKSTGYFWGIIVIVWAIFTYLVVQIFLPGRATAESYLYVYQPVLWCTLAVLAWLGWRYGLSERPKLAFPLTLTSMLLGFGQVAAWAIAGLLLGFGHSPYSHQADAVFRNMLYVLTLLSGLEMVRAYLVVRFKQGHPWVSFVLISLFLALLRIAPVTFSQLHPFRASIQVIGERLLPTLAQNLLATLLALLGGPLASMIYLGSLQLFEWLSPILPNPGWFVTAFIGTVIPAYGLVIVYNQFVVGSIEEGETEPDGQEQAQVGESGEFISWAIVAVMILVLVGFNTGLFGVHPSLIGSGSMTPNLMVGDIIIARDVPVETIKVGDIITFQQEGITIVHRVIDIQNENGKITFITKGDANDSADPPVASVKYKGKVIFTIPKIGWISIYVRNVLVKIL